MEKRPLVGITMGDPAGIGPEIIIRALLDDTVYDICRPLVIGDPAVLETAMRAAGKQPDLHRVDTPDRGNYKPSAIDVLNPGPSLSRPVEWGRPTPESGRLMETWITAAADLAMAGSIHAVVTCPINKEALKLGGSRFPGHTEMLAARTNTKRYAMMLAGDRLRVVLVTIHMALRNVPDAISIEAVSSTIALTAESLSTRFGIPLPKIAVAGLNPHAGENGMFGNEEETLIAPAIERAKKETGHDITGPFPPDTVFTSASRGDFDAVVCMYHDQGLIPFKLLHFEDGVNTTLGLPIIRTSVDHGTAYDIAGRGVADCRSLLAAIRMAALQASCLANQRTA